MKDNILHDIRVYVAACKQERIDRLLPTLKHLGIDGWTVAQVRPGNPDEYGQVLFDQPSRRFVRQLSIDIDRPYMWLEDDAEIAPDFQERWQPYNETLPDDWKIAVIGWGIVFDGTEHKPVNAHWCQLRGKNESQWKDYGTVGAFGGIQCAIINSGEWRNELAKQQFRCDSGLYDAMQRINIDGLYLSTTILVGTNDPLTTFGKVVVQYPVYSKPRRFSWAKHNATGNGYSEFL